MPCKCEEMEKNTALVKQARDVELKIEVIEDRIRAYEEIAVKRWERSNVGKRFASCTFESYDRGAFDKQWNACKRFAETFENNTGKGLMLYGSVGTGKTHLAAAVGWHIVYELGYSVLFVPFTELLNELKNNMNNKEYVKDFMKKLYNSDLLIMDDLGKEKYTEWSQEQLFSLLDKRYRDCKPIIVTTNYMPQELSRRVDEAVMSRIIGTCALIGMNGEDYRASHRK